MDPILGPVAVALFLAFAFGRSLPAKVPYDVLGLGNACVKNNLILAIHTE